jgi:hypothetical protein
LQKLDEIGVPKEGREKFSNPNDLVQKISVENPNVVPRNQITSYNAEENNPEMADKESFFGNPYLLQMVELPLTNCDKMSAKSSFQQTMNGNMILTGSEGSQILDLSGGLGSARTMLGRSNMSFNARDQQLNITIREVL